jgi:hypothetical protein
LSENDGFLCGAEMLDVFVVERGLERVLGKV